MATADERALRLGALSDLLDRYGLGLVHLAVLNVVLFGLAARLYALGARPAHWDEARVAYWILDFARTGNVEYRPIIHGPFYHHVNAVVFDVFGTGDGSMRLVVALLGGLFPLVALCFRARLRDVEVAALAALLAFNPILLYYTRFMRGDPLVAVFMVGALGLFVRFLDTRSVGYFHGAVVFTALGFTVKENALLYLLSYVGATALVADTVILRSDVRGATPREQLVEHYRRGRRLLFTYWRTGALAVVEFVAVIVYFYAPRAATEEGPGLWKAIAGPDPVMLGTVFWEGTVGAWQDMWGLWISGGHQNHAYPPYFIDFAKTLEHGALALCVLALVGFVADRYSEGGPRVLVSFAFFWGVASVLGYPMVTDIKAPWATVHAVVPLAIPAAVGLGLFLRWLWDAGREGAPLTAAAGAFALLFVVASVATAGVGAVYENPASDDNQLVQYAQPADDVGPAMDRLAAVAPAHEGADVALYSDYFVDSANATGEPEPACARWFNALPLPWYFATADADVNCLVNTGQLETLVEDDRPPMVIARAHDRRAVADELTGYESRTYRLRVYGTETVVFVREDVAGDLPRTGVGPDDPVVTPESDDEDPEPPER